MRLKYHTPRGSSTNARPVLTSVTEAAQDARHAAPPAGRPRPDRARPHRRLGDGHHAPARAPADRLRGDVQGADDEQRARARQPVSLANLGWVRQHFSSNLDNLQLLDEEVARDEALLFKHAGGQTFVDPTNRGLARDPLALARVARATGLNIIMGSGYYVAAAHPSDMDRRRADDITREIVTDLLVGVGDTGVRAGFIGEIGTTWPWTDNEKKVVRAAVAAQRETGAALMIHPGRHERLPLEIVRFIRAEGADLGRTIMCHVERTIADPGVLLELAATGVFLEYDL